MAKGDVRVAISGDNKGLKKALKDSDRLVGNFAKKGGGALKGFAAQIGGLGRAFGLINPALAGVAGVGGIGFLIKSSIDAAVEIENLARTAGIGVEQFQELQFAASQTGINVDGLTDGIKELNLRADEFAVTAKGSSAEAFERIGMSPAEVNERLGKPVEFMDEILERVAKLDRASQIRIFDELFGGTAGEQFTRIFDGSITSLRAFRKEARDLGLVLSKETLAGARAADRELSKLGQVLQVQFTRIALQLTPAIVELAKELRENLQPALAEIASQFGSFRFFTLEQLEADLARLEKERDKLKSGEPIKREDIVSGDFDIRSVPIVGGFGVDRFKDQREARLKEINDEISDRKKLIAERKITNAAFAGSRPKRAAVESPEAKKLREGLADLRSDLEFERAQLDRNTREQRLYNEARKLGTTVTAEFRAQFGPLINDIDAETKAKEKAKEAQEKINKANEKFKQDAKQIFEGTRTSAERYADEVKRLKVFLDAGAISQDTFNRAVAKAKEDMDNADKSASVFADTLNQVTITVGDAFADAVVEGGNLREVFDGLAQDVQKLILKVILLNSLKGALEEFGIDTGREKGADAGIFGEVKDFFGGEGGGLFDEFADLFKSEKQKQKQTTPTTSLLEQGQSPADCIGDSFTLICDEFADLDPGETTAELESWLDNFGDSFNDVDATGAVDKIQQALDNVGDMFEGFTVTDAGGKGQTEQLIGSIAGGIFGSIGGSGFDASAGFTDGGFQIEPSNFQGDTGGPLTAAAKGAIFEDGVRFMKRGGLTGRRGGIISSPTLFSSAGGLTIGGEAGDEAIMPVRRDKRGRLGVEMIGGQALNFNAVIEINGATDFDSFAQNESQMQGMIMEAGQQAFQRNRSI